MKNPPIFTMLIILVFLIIISACQLPIKTSVNSLDANQEIDVPFETVVLDEEGFVSALGERPQLLMINSSDEITPLVNSVSRKALQKLRTVDFQHYFLVGLFRNAKPSGGYPTYIKRILKHGNQLVVYAELWEPPPIYTGIIDTTATYHVVQIARDENLPGSVEPMLEAQILTPTPLSK